MCTAISQKRTLWGKLCQYYENLNLQYSFDVVKWMSYDITSKNDALASKIVRFTVIFSTGSGRPWPFDFEELAWQG